jgi:hypothetical protein
MRATGSETTTTAGAGEDVQYRPRLRRALAAAVTLLALAGVAAGGTMIVLQARSNVRDRAVADLHERARAAAAVVAEEVNSDIAKVSGVATQPRFALAVAGRRWPYAQTYAAEMLKSHPRLASARILDVSGFLRVRVPASPTAIGKRFSQQEYFKAARAASTVHISKIFVELGTPKGVVVAYSMAIKVRAAHGVLVATMPISAFEELLAQYLPPGGEIRLYDAYGELIEPSSRASARSNASDPVVGATLTGRSSARLVGGRLFESAPVTGPSWAVVVSQPSAIIDHEAQHLAMRLSWIAGGIMLLAMIAAFAAWRRQA